jgi:predicted RNA-binding Zn ribbon-like protein
MRLIIDTYRQYLPVSYTSSNVSPRYDIPKAAPEPLRQVQLLVNSQDLHNEVDWLDDWLQERDLVSQTRRVAELRTALRSLILANNGFPLEAGAVEVFNLAARRVPLQLGANGVPAMAADGDALDQVVAIALGAMLDGTWGRLKACRNCRWAFYDYSPPRKATWCSMQLCGNRAKTRAYRSRRKLHDRHQDR